MKSIRFLLIGMCVLCFFMHLEAKAASKEEKSKIKNCFYYALPENYFTVTVVIEKVSAYKGPLVNYAHKVAGISSVVKKDSVYYAVSSVKLEEHARIDFQHVYYVETESKGVSYHILYKDLLLSNYDKDAASSWRKETPFNSDTHILPYNRFSAYTEEMVEILDTSYVERKHDTIVEKTPKITKKVVAKPTYQQAMDIIKKMENIRQARITLINGELETDFSNLEFMLSGMRDIENEYLSLFGGVTEIEELSYTFTVTPSPKSDVIALPLFEFLGKYGIDHQAVDAAKIDYILKFSSNGINEAIEKANKNYLPQKNKKEVSNNLYYRKPQYFMISLYEGEKLMHDFGIYPISQFGETVPLPSNAHSFEIDPLTGSLKYINITE